MFDEQPNDGNFDAVIASYAQACQHMNTAAMREGYIALRDMCEGATRSVAPVPAGEAPPLPEAEYLGHDDSEDERIYGYTADQMRERDAMWLARLVAVAGGKDGA